MRQLTEIRPDGRIWVNYMTSPERIAGINAWARPARRELR
jgi:hypothetical protein